MKIKLLFLMLITMMVFCVGCAKTVVTVLANDQITSKHGLKSPIKIQYDEVHDNIIKAELKLLNNTAKINVKYLEGTTNNLKVYLFNSDTDEYIQLSDIVLNGRIEFSNLTSASTYYIGIECQNTDDFASATIYLAN